jgi:GTPase SAR1 family protein
MEIIKDNEELDEISKNSNIQTIKVCLIGIDNTGKTSFLDRILS